MVWSLLAEISQRPSAQSRRVMTLVWPIELAHGRRRVAGGFLRQFPQQDFAEVVARGDVSGADEADRRDPVGVPREVQRRRRLVKVPPLAELRHSCQQVLHGLRSLRRGPDGPCADVVLRARVDAQRGVDRREQVAFAHGVVLDVPAVGVGGAVD